ncbi:MAG: RNA polymerase sigma-70 factor [Acidobacteria bacterium]|nr:MAG: RNA polymerase sigma-70 factor [Acidobacteriota bacterium]
MSAPRAAEDLAVFESHRPAMLGLAYRMLGDVGRAQDMVQEAWLRWQQRDVDVDSPKAFLVTVVTRLCLNELTSARGEPPRSPARAGWTSRKEAILVVLERLTPAERATLLLHDVFDFAHEEIATLVARTPAACRKLLERARHKVAAGRRLISAPREQHQQLLDAFVRAASVGDVAGLVDLLAPDAVLVTDGGPEGRVFRGLRNLRRPLTGAARVAAFVVATSRRAAVDVEPRELNGQPALVFYRDELPFAAVLLAVADGKIQRVFFHADVSRLRYLGHARPRPGAGRT